MSHSATLRHPPAQMMNYLTLRSKLTRHALAGLAASLRQGTPVLAIALGPVLIAFLALLAWPVLDAATRSDSGMMATIAAQAFLGVLPFLSLRHQLLPADFLAWERSLPIRRRTRWAADGVTAGQALAPLLLAYAISTTIWFWQSPAWLQPVQRSALYAVAATASGTWIVAWMVLSARREFHWQFRSHTPAKRSVTTMNLPTPGATATKWCLIFCLIILPFLRIGRRRVAALQAILMAGGILSTDFWLRSETSSTALPALTTSALLLIQAAHADLHGRALWRQLEPAARPWPISPSFILGACRCLTLAPGIITIGVFAALYVNGTDRNAPALAIAWIFIAATTIVWLIYWSRPATATRQAVLLLAFTLLSAIGNAL